MGKLTSVCSCWETIGTSDESIVYFEDGKQITEKEYKQKLAEQKRVNE